MKISEFATDNNLEESGVWVNIDDDESPDGTHLLVARLYNDNFNEVFERKTKAQTTRGRSKSFSRQAQKRIMRECIAETILLDWKNLKDDKGKNIPYTQARALKFLEMRDFSEVVVEIANSMETFRAEEKEEEEKNSKAS